MNERWFVVGGDRQKRGPYTAAQLKKLAADAKLKPTDKVQREGMDRWTTAGAVKGLFPTVEKKAPPRPRGNPPWLWLAVGGGALALAALVATVIFVVVLATRSQPPQKVQSNPPPPPPFVPQYQRPVPSGPAGQPTPLPPTTRQPSQPPVDPAPRPVEPPAPPVPAPIDVASLPPAKDRPFLVLDPSGHTATVTRALFTPDGRQLITASSDKTVRLTDLLTGDTLRVYHLPVGPGQEGSLYAAALSPNGQRLAVGGMPFGSGKHGVLIHLVNLQSGQIEQTLTGHRGTISDLAFSPDGTVLASAAHDKTIRLYNLATSQCTVLDGQDSTARRMAFTPDGSLLATVNFAGHGRIWSLATGKVIAELPARQLPQMSLAWSPDGRTLATGSLDCKIHLYSREGVYQKTYEVAPGEPTQLATLRYSKDGRELLYAGVDVRGRAGIFNLATGKRRVDFKDNSNSVQDANFSPDGTLAVTTGGDNHETLVWSTADGRIVQRLQGQGKAVWGVGWSPDSKLIGWGNTNFGKTREATTRLEHTFRLDSLELGPAPVGEFRRVPASVGGYSINGADFFKLIIRKGGAPLYTFVSPIKDERIYSYSVLAGNQAAIGGSQLYLLDLPTKKIVRTFRGHAGLIMGISPSPDGRYFLTGSADQTLRLWQADQDEPLLTLFVAGQDWIAWTPQGYYAASPYGERLMGWQVNQGPGTMGTFYPAAQFRRSLYHPEVIRLIPQAGSLDKALALAAGGQQPALTPIQVGQVLPPSVTVTAPAGVGELRIKETKLEVKAVAHSFGNQPVIGMRLLLDGRPFQGQKGVRTFTPPKAGDVEAAWTVDLMPGQHTLVVQAVSAVSYAVSPPRVVTVDGVDREGLPALYLLAVGISEYPGNMALQRAAADAVVLDKVLREKSSGVFREVQSKIILDKQATRAEIFRGLAWLQGKMTARDVGIISFSGHGCRDRRGNFYMITVDVNDADIAGSCVSGDALKKALENMPGRLIALLDACHAGTVAEKDARAAAGDLVRDLVTEDYGVIVMCASLGREYSLESPATGHGFFTLGVVEALRGSADYNHDGFIYVHEVDWYAQARVRQLSRGMQHPVSGRPPGIRSFPLAKP